jgi:hypothetical protein
MLPDKIVEASNVKTGYDKMLLGYSCCIVVGEYAAMIE